MAAQFIPSLNFKLIVGAGATILLLGVISVVMFLLLKKRREKIIYDTLVEVLPEWASAEKLKEGEITKEELERLKSAYGAEYYIGGLTFDESKGLYFLIIKTKPKPIKVVIDNPYYYARAIEYWGLGKYNVRRQITLYRKSPHDYKPVRVIVQGAEQIKNVIDTESMATHFITLEELRKKYERIEGLRKWKDFIIMGAFFTIFIIFVIVMIYINNNYTKVMKEVGNALVQAAKALKAATP